MRRVSQNLLQFCSRLGFSTALIVVATWLAGCGDDEPGGVVADSPAATVATTTGSPLFPGLSPSPSPNGSPSPPANGPVTECDRMQESTEQLRGQAMLYGEELGALPGQIAQASATMDGLQAEYIATEESTAQLADPSVCTQHCEDLGARGTQRWAFGAHGHLCPDPVTDRAYCHCSHEEGMGDACAELTDGGNLRRLKSMKKEMQSPRRMQSCTPMAVQMDFFQSTMVQNNLGGLGPEVGEENIRFQRIGDYNGQDFDMLVTTVGAYDVSSANANGLIGMFGQVNLAAGREVTLRFSFVTTSDNQPITLEKFSLSFFDLDNSRRVGEELTVRGSSGYQVADGYEFDISEESDGSPTFTATHRGGGCDNPRDPSNLTPISCDEKSIVDPLRRAVMFDFENVNYVEVMFKTPCRVRGCDDRGSRNLCFAGEAQQLRMCEPTLGAPPTTPTDVVDDFCNMTGFEQLETYGFVPGEVDQLESSILLSVAQQIERTNTDRMARDTFSVYMCVRWVPDPTFWNMARQELAAELVNPMIVDEAQQSEDQAVAELYQKYKFVPMLCSRNVDLFGESDWEDGTHFRHFRREMNELILWLSTADTNSLVMDRLRRTDEVFCGNTNMNDPECLDQIENNWRARVNGYTSFFGGWGVNYDSVEDRWERMAEIFRSFEEPGTNSEFATELAQWRQRFPFHSFVHKPEGMPAEHSPSAGDRFVVCFGKRVASALHRRPAGLHLMTDQNNIGCHGFWTAERATMMLGRTIELWKPPTCQVSTMSYMMKRRILSTFAFMNEKLFDSLPSMVMDDMLAGGLPQSSRPGPYDPQTVVEGGTTFVDGMRVRGVRESKDPPGCRNWAGLCNVFVAQGGMGVVSIADGGLAVIWDADERTPAEPIPAPGDALQILPREWGRSRALVGVASSVVAGMDHVSDGAAKLRDVIFMRDRVTNGLESLTVNSKTKWVVCPVKDGANYSALDSKIDVEDSTFMDLSRDAYGRWARINGELPGVVCETPAFLDPVTFPGAQICPIAELHVDYFEKFTLDSGEEEEFVCPIQMILPAAEQLTILQNKGTCFVRMTQEQEWQHMWNYNGYYPGRKQHDAKENVPAVEYELVKIIKVPATENGPAAIARMCTVQEAVEAPRFCRPPAVYEPWSTLEEMAADLDEAIQGALGVGATALADSVNGYSAELAQRYPNSEMVRATAVQFGGRMWDELSGVTRLEQSRTERIVSPVSQGLAGAYVRDARIEAELFWEDCACHLVHQLSFQRAMGRSAETNKDYYSKYVVSMPCDDFDPARDFAIKKRWSSIALRMLSSTFSAGVQNSLSSPHLSIALRGEGRFFVQEGVTFDSDDFNERSGFVVGSAMKMLSNAEVGQIVPNCEFSYAALACMPQGCGVRSGTTCVPIATPSASGWWSASDDYLTRLVGGPASQSNSTSGLRGIRMNMYCGPKNRFGETGGPAPPSSVSLETCLLDGIKTNARLKALEPWKTFFPGEVVVVAEFSALTQRECTRSADLQTVLCGNADSNGEFPEGGIDGHLTTADRTSIFGGYQGLATGAGFPQATPREVVMKPEDVLEVAGVLRRSGTGRRLEEDRPPPVEPLSCPSVNSGV